MSGIPSSPTYALSSIIDNQAENTLLHALERRTEHGRELCIATAFFSLDALNLLGKHLLEYDRVRLLFGDDANPRQRTALLKAMRDRSDQDLLQQREGDATLAGLQHAAEVIKQGKFEARCYTKKKFHAKAYLVARGSHPPLLGIIGSGNFTRPGLTQNIELNVDLTVDQCTQLHAWYEARWEEAQGDVVTQDLLKEITRQIDLYDPYAIYQRALFAWGKHYQGGIDVEQSLKIRDTLDAHQSLGYKRALEILERENGVMICDGVGLGKSFIALALMEHFCRRKKNVLLIAPKSIMSSSWVEYLKTYLEEFRQPYGTIHEKYMTDLAIDLEEEPDSDKQEQKRAELKKLAERADVIVVDESHNFRSTEIQRYINLMVLTKSPSPDPDQRKKVILLTATPVNTAYGDLSAQLALISNDDGLLNGYSVDKVRSAANYLDKSAKKKQLAQPVLDLTGIDDDAAKLIWSVQQSIIIQRKRTTCVALAAAQNKILLFPNREKPRAIGYDPSSSFIRVIETSERRFAPTAAWLKKVRDEYDRAAEAGVEIVPPKMPANFKGIKLAAFLPEQYRIAGPRAKRSYQFEITLANLVFVNAIKQLESSPPAFQGIIQSLGAGLVARLSYVFGTEADADIQPHSGWIRTSIHHIESDDADGSLEAGASADLNGEDLDKWLEKAISGRHLHHKLAEFTDECFNRAKWRKDILQDLEYLREIHTETVEARGFPDYKLEMVKTEVRHRLETGQRIVIFSQSQRTAHYVEGELAKAFPEIGVARIDSNVKQETRDGILYSFCPLYNPVPRHHHKRQVRILICTDVLSEGVNMQEAECILNYDIHWNPVRLIQRIGRVDRRLDPAKTPVPHTISILNVLPPKKIEDIIKLVNTVERRRTIINDTMGIDASFFKATDPEGTLREFNQEIDGELSIVDRANERFIRAIAEPDPELLATLALMPLGAFGVWDKAPVNGVFALFEMTGTKELAEADAAHFRAILGRPVLALMSGEKVIADAPEILELLSGTVKGVHSGDPSDAAKLQKDLKALRNKVNQSFKGISLSASIQPKLICWMELRKAM